MRKEMVDHPAHYQSKAGIEVIDVMEAFTENLSGAEAVNTSQVIKYILRWKEKENPLQDLKKCKWYLERLIGCVEGANVGGKIYVRPGIPYDTEEDALAVLAKMRDIVDECGCASISDLHYLSGETSLFKDVLYGWRNLDAVEVVYINGKYIIDFPKVEKL